MKDFVYIVNIRLPTEKAHGIQIMKTCEALALNGINVELIVPDRKNKIKDEPFSFYGMKKSFTITSLKVIDFVVFGKIGFIVGTILFTFTAIRRLRTIKKSVIYGRDYILLFFISFFNSNIIWESHTGELNFLVLYFIKRIQKMVVITHGLKDLYVRNGVPSEKICVLPDAVDMDVFTVNETKDDCRKKYNLPAGNIVMYTGHLYDWKGVYILADAAKLLPEISFVFVGGTDGEVSDFKRIYQNTKNILILGRMPYADIPYLLKSADILVIPNSRKNKISELYTSPMKLFEYMASGVPIVASDIPSIKEILTPRMATFVEPDDPEDLARGIGEMVKHRSATLDKANSALEEVSKYTWNKRARKIIDSFTKTT